MKKMALVLVALVALGSLSFAQKGAMSIGGDLGLFLPLGDMGEYYSMGFGICPTFDYVMNEKLSLTGTIGYVSWGSKEEVDGWEYSFSDIPLKAGAKYYFGGGTGIKPYGIGELGFHMLTASVKGEILGYSFDESASETKLGLGFGAGFEYPMNEKMALNVLGEYETIMTEGDAFNNFVIKAGIKYDLK
ncbi:MAG: outer membrane beta-barrel protein [Candidatus Edwardsbacteria bacterium]|nr:outer membrane beta-barrel protein [Candidatus Edwardsbacteria bacterium]